MIDIYEEGLMMRLKYKNRHRLSRVDTETMKKRLETVFQIPIVVLGSDKSVDIAKLKEHTFSEVIFADGEIVACTMGQEAFLTLHGLIACDYTRAKRYVTVDKGAVSFICNGADVMAPGIVDADKNIKVGELVWVRDETHLKPLAIGQALIPGTQMGVHGSRGKAVKTLHYIGDDFWNLSSKQWRSQHYDYAP
jgi:PUA domain protein